MSKLSKIAYFLMVPSHIQVKIDHKHYFLPCFSLDFLCNALCLHTAIAPPAKAPPVAMPTQNGSHVDLIVFDSVLELSAIAEETCLFTWIENKMVED